MEESKPVKSNKKPILIGCGIATSIGVLVCIIGAAAAIFWLATSPEGLDAWEAEQIRNES